MDIEFIRPLVEEAETKIVLLVMDGLGGLSREPVHLTELEAADTPNLDGLATWSQCGLQEPVGPGITPGSGPGHLALFGYDPIRFQVGRGVLSALGIGFELQSNDVAARGNFCTLDEEGRVADRRAGRIPTEKNRELVSLLREISLPGVEVLVETVQEYRFLLVLRGEGLSGEVDDTDPQDVGEKPLAPRARSREAEHTAELVARFVDEARVKLADRHPANGVLLRGFAKEPQWPQFAEAFRLRAAVIAAYPMYRGVAKLVGMDVLEGGQTIEEEIDTLERVWDEYDYFFLHYKPVDSAGEDGDFERKVSLIEHLDSLLPRVLDLEPDVLIVTGDHSTPSLMRYHSWHPVPVMVWSRVCRADGVHQFHEKACMSGGLGPRFPGKDLIALALANAGRLGKYGA